MVASTQTLSRRDLMKGASVGVGALSGVFTASPAAAAPSLLPAHTETRHYWTAEYWARKGDVKLNLYRKRTSAPQSGEAPLPVLFFAHGSSVSSRPSFDLSIPGHGEYSMMNVFAAAGFDTWTMDFEGYGRSTQTEGNSDIKSGVQDLEAAIAVLERETRLTRYHFYGESSGALRVGAFAMSAPGRVNRLLLAAFTYTGKGSPTLAKRAEDAEFYRTHNRRKRDNEMIHSIFTRDKPGTTDPAVADAVAAAELKFGDSVPTGTYLDMTMNLPLVQPQQVHAPTLLVRGEYDGIATVADLLDFYAALPNADRQFAIIPNAAHGLGSSYNRSLLWYVMLSFLNLPEAQPLRPSVPVA
jgi:pimeloyl-ACP methyl ester carboxylesterase